MNGGAAGLSKENKKILFSLKDWSKVGPIKVGTTSLVPVHEYNPIAEESSSQDKSPMGDKNSNSTPKSENMFHFQQAVAYKMKHKDKMTRTILRD